MRTPILLAACALLAAPARSAESYADHVASLRAERVAELTKPDGWLTVVGLNFLDPGKNSVGSAAGNQVVLAGLPAQLGTLTLSPANTATFASAGDGVTIDGKKATEGALRPDGQGVKATVVSWGTVSFYLIERGGRLAVRSKDSGGARRTHFLGLDYFPTDPSWRIEAAWVPFDAPRQIAITNVIGNVLHERATGKAVFERGGRTYELTPVDEGPGEPLFFVFSDATTGESTYRMRFLDADQPRDGKVVLDFNLAENPPCAFTPFATCPLPPKENQLELPVTAGEKNYRGAHD